MENYILLFGAGLAAGFLNVTAGGGSTLTLPALIFMGLDTALANGTNRVAILIQNIFAAASFKSDKYSNFKVSLKLALFTLPGGAAGALLAVNLGDAAFKMILGIIMIAIIFTMLIPRKKAPISPEYENKPPAAAYFAMFGIGFYGGFIQVGVGFLLMAALSYIMKLSLVKTNMHKVFIVLVFTLPAIAVFFITGNVDLKLGLALAVGNASGGWIGAKVSVRKGDKFIKWALIAGMLIMALKLFGVF